MDDSISKAQQLLTSVFFEAGMAAEDLQLRPRLTTGATGGELSGAKRDTLEKKKTELSGILTKLGLKDVKDRLTVDAGGFRLSSNSTQHGDDSAVLFDLTKIGPLVDAGFAVLDAEPAECGHSIVILALDADVDFEIPTSDDLEAVEFDNESAAPVEPAATLKLAEDFVAKVKGSVKK